VGGGGGVVKLMIHDLPICRLIFLREAWPCMCAGKEPAVEVREQDAHGRVHRVAGSGSGLTEAGREAQAQMARRRLMKTSPQVALSH